MQIALFHCANVFGLIGGEIFDRSDHAARIGEQIKRRIQAVVAVGQLDLGHMTYLQVFGQSLAQLVLVTLSGGRQRLEVAQFVFERLDLIGADEAEQLAIQQYLVVIGFAFLILGAEFEDATLQRHHSKLFEQLHKLISAWIVSANLKETLI